MMIKLSEQSSIHAVGRVDAVALASSIATAPQDDIERATNRSINQAAVLIKGDHYPAKVIAKRSNSDFDIEIAGFKLNMQLGSEVTVGQKLLMTYMGGTLPPTFQMLGTDANNHRDTSLHLSSAANIIKQSLLLSDSQPPTISTQIITNQPKNSEVTAQQLKTTLVFSGLFYESHLADFVDGNYTLQALKQEPQNTTLQESTRQNQLLQPQTLIPQQLALLESNHFNWQGQVWPGQVMEWDVWANHSDDSEQSPTAVRVVSEQQGSSQLTLHLPNLGKVSVRLDYKGDKIRVNIQADQADTTALLKDSSRHLVHAFQENGQPLESVLVR